MCQNLSTVFFRKYLYITTEISAFLKIMQACSLENFISKIRLVRRFYFTIEGPTISDNILLLSADMENLEDWASKPPRCAIQKTVGLNILSQPCTVPTIELLLSLLCMSIVIELLLSLLCMTPAIELLLSLPCTVHAIELLLFPLYGARYRAALVCLVRRPL